MFGMLSAIGSAFGFFGGQLPAECQLEIKGVYFDEAAAAGDLMAFDTGLVAATTFVNETALSSGLSVSAWARVRDPDISTALVRAFETQVYCVPKVAVAAAARGDVVVMGSVTLVKAASANHAVGADFMPSGAAPEKVCVPFVSGTTLSTNAHNRKIVAKALTAGTSTTALTAHLNGFGWGVVWVNASGFNADAV
jgi:hypothetical protein